MRTLLEEDDDIFDVIEGILTLPEETEGYAAKRKKFLKADKTARKLIVTAVEHEMWKKLNTVYDMKSEENLSMVQKQFFDFKWQENESVAHNMSKIEQLSVKMKALGSDVGEKMLITKILTSLPRKFNHFHSAWDSIDEEKKTLDSLTTRLITEESRWKNDEEKEETSVALVTKANNNNRKEQPKQTNVSGGKCFNFGRTRHQKKECTRCFICKRNNHKSSECHFRDKNKKEQQSRNNGKENNNQRERDS